MRGLGKKMSPESGRVFKETSLLVGLPIFDDREVDFIYLPLPIYLRVGAGRRKVLVGKG